MAVAPLYTLCTGCKARVNRNSVRRSRLTGRRDASDLRVQTRKAWAKPTADFGSLFVRANALLLIESIQVIDLAEREGFEIGARV